MGLVQYALKFRITIYVLAVLMMLGGAAAVVVAPKDVLPTVDIPVVVVVWTYNGLSTSEMERRITPTPSSRSPTTSTTSPVWNRPPCRVRRFRRSISTGP